MLSRTYCIALSGVEGSLVNVEVDVSNGLPSWDIVGLPDAVVRESKERVRTAIKNSELTLPNKKIVVNLAPAHTKKEGATFDLAIAIGILKNAGSILKENLDDFIFIGELSLDGSVNKVKGVLVMCIAAKELGKKRIVVPYENRFEAGIIKGVEILPVKNLNQVVDMLNNKTKIDAFVSELGDTNVLKSSKLDFADVKGQENVRRALEIVAAGGHNCILVGSPGAGKTMLSERLPTILPELTFEESLEITKIQSVAGVLPEDVALVRERPFRSPHNKASITSLLGGGSNPKPGEITLAHYGVLFLDELMEFSRAALESLRGPLEDRKITISRTSSTVMYPANFIFIASMNPCPCGYLHDKKKECVCSPSQIINYKNKLSGPILDRIDLHVEVERVDYKELQSDEKIENSETIRARVNAARKIQLERYKDDGIISNSELTASILEKYCVLDKETKEFFERAFNTYGYSARTYSKILKIARTIADLEGCDDIKIAHVAEAVQYRTLDRSDQSSL